MFVSLYVVIAFMFAASLSFKDKFLATGWTGIVIGAGYFVWGLVNTFGVPDSLTSPDDRNRMLLGVGVVVFGLVLLGLNWHLRIRRDMARS